MPTSHLETPSLVVKATRFDYRDRSWTNTPGYYALPRDQRPVNAYNDTTFFITQQSGQGAWHYPLPSGTSLYDLLPGPPLIGNDIYSRFSTCWSTESDFVPMANRVFDQTTLKLLGDVADMKTNLGVMYAEARKTSDLILSSAHRIYDAYASFRRGNFRRAANDLNIRKPRFHKNWLEYKYGWMPLLQDVKLSAEFFAQQTLGGRPPRFSVQRKGSETTEWSKTTTYAPAYGGGSTSGTWTESLLGKYTCRQKLMCEVVNPRFNQLMQLGLTNPALIAWELVPYSFVFDWFYSVGDWLTGLTALQGVTVRKSLRSNVNDIIYSYSQPLTNNIVSGSVWINDARKRGVQFRQYARSTLTINPSSITIPRQMPNSFQKLVSGLALLRGKTRHW